MDLSIVIPAYEEAKKIARDVKSAAEFLVRNNFSGEVIVVDDGSRDDTAEVARKTEVPQQVRLETIRYEPHRGKGYAVRTGMLRADAKYLFFVDADLSVPISEVGKMIGSLEAGHDIAIGTREGIGASRENEPFVRHILGRAFNILVRALSGLAFQDTQCGFKGFRRKVAHDLFARVQLYGSEAKPLKGRAITAFDVEVLYLAVRAGYDIDEVPVRWVCGDTSRDKLFVDPARMFVDVLKVRLLATRGAYETPGSEARPS